MNLAVYGLVLCNGCLGPCDGMDLVTCSLTGDTLCRSCHAACASLTCARVNDPC